MRNIFLATVLVFGLLGSAQANDLIGTWGSPCYNKREEGISFRAWISFEQDMTFLERLFNFNNLNCEEEKEGKSPKATVITVGKGSYSSDEFEVARGEKRNLLRKFYSARQVIFKVAKEKLSEKIQKDFEDYSATTVGWISKEEAIGFMDAENYFLYAVTVDELNEASNKYEGSATAKRKFNEALRKKNSIGFPYYFEYSIADGVLTEFDGPIRQLKRKIE